jgi:hypothetical protein
MMKLSPAQINALRLAKEGCLGVGRFHITIGPVHTAEMTPQELNPS